MARMKLDSRRLADTVTVTHTYHNGNTQTLVVTYGWDQDSIREAFCSSFPVGSDMMTLAVDASILLSRCLQHGDCLNDISVALCNPNSIIGTIVRTGITLEQDGCNEREVSRPDGCAGDINLTSSTRLEGTKNRSSAPKKRSVLVHLLAKAVRAVRALWRPDEGRRVQ